ncbi:MAG TPA: DUF2934 domain-containing protein [Phycisphaerae bacterium]|nr:DUF2934 domain-containing protein [Phycisphaerae bacterium]
MVSRRNQQQKSTSPKSMPASAVTGRDPITEEHIRFHAYMLFQERQRAGVPGDPVSDWLRAQSELNQAAPQAGKLVSREAR